MTKTYDELIKINSFEDRYDYLRLDSDVGEVTFGYDRYINQLLYHNPKWKSFRNKIIMRDNGCDMACDDYPIGGRIIVHHINPITRNDILEQNPNVYDENNVVCVSHYTHEAIHYGDCNLLPKNPIVRMPGDTCPWK